MNSSEKKHQRVYLTGFMGSGKSTIGPILANTIGYEYLDIDRDIEAREGLSVATIFREKGEEYFRQREREVLESVSSRPRCVISLGGGTLSDPACYKIIKPNGILVYLRVTPEQTFRRLQNKTDRPMLLDEDGNRLAEPELRTRIKTLLEKREPLYNSADIIIMTDDRKVGQTVDILVKKLSGWIV